MHGRAYRSEWRWLYDELQPFLGTQLLSIALLLGVTFLSLVDPLILKWIVDSGLMQRDSSVLWMGTTAFLVIHLVRLAMMSGGNLITARMIQMIMLRLRLRLLRRLQSLDAPFYDRTPVGDLVQRIEKDIDQLGHTGATLMPNFARIVVSVAFTLAIMAFLSWQLACLCLPFVPLLLFLRSRFRTRLERASDTARAAEGERASVLTEALASAIQVQLMRGEGFFYRRYGRRSLKTARVSLRQRRLEILYIVTSLGLMAGATAAILLAGAFEYLRGTLSLGGYVAFYSYLMRLFNPLSGAVEAYARLKSAGGSIRRISELEGIRHSLPAFGNGREISNQKVRQIMCRNLEFSYEGESGQNRVLKQIDLTIAQGEKVALVGQSGSGKSTLAKLLLRIYDPQDGQILIQEQDLRHFGLQTVRRHVAFAPADPVLFRGSIKQNVFLGRKPISQSQLDRMAQVACFDSVVRRLPQEWGHQLGSGGAGLSDGERQRLGLVRVLLRDCSLLILDEATGALDPDTEAQVLANLGYHVKDKAVLLITHRLATACWADRIMALRDGCLEAVSNPQGLADFSASVGSEIWGPSINRKRA